MTHFFANPAWDQNLTQLKAIVGGMTEGVVAFDSAGKFYFANRAALTLYDLHPSELPNSVHDLDARFELYDLDGQLVPEAAYPTARLLRGESFRDYRVWVHRQGETRRWLGSYNGEQVDDTVSLCVRSVRDITAQYELELRHRATFDINPTAISVAQLTDLRFTEVNESFLRLTGYERGEVVGKTADELGLRLERDKRAAALRQLRNGAADDIVEHEAVMRMKTGDYRTVLSEGRVIHLDSTPYLIDTYLDISDRKRAENELVQAVQMAMRDPTWFVRVVQDKLAEVRAGQAPKPGLELLTPRELDVLGAVAQGLSNDQIAQQTKLAAQTVRNYISNIYDKLELHSRAEAIVWARERGLVFPD